MRHLSFRHVLKHLDTHIILTNIIRNVIHSEPYKHFVFGCTEFFFLYHCNGFIKPDSRKLNQLWSSNRLSSREKTKHFLAKSKNIKQAQHKKRKTCWHSREWDDGDGSFPTMLQRSTWTCSCWQKMRSQIHLKQPEIRHLHLLYIYTIYIVGSLGLCLGRLHEKGVTQKGHNCVFQCAWHVTWFLFPPWEHFRKEAKRRWDKKY